MQVVRVEGERRDLQPVALEDVAHGIHVDARHVDVRRPGVPASLAPGCGPARDLEHLEALARGPRGDLLQGTTWEGSGEQSELHRSGCDDGIRDRLEPLDLDRHLVARPQESLRIPEHADAGGRPREDEVARLERRGLRHIGDHVVDPEDEIRGRRVLQHLAAHDRPDRESVRVRDLVARRHRPDRAERVGRLATGPLPVRELEIAGADVVRAQVPAYGLERVLLGDAPDP